MRFLVICCLAVVLSIQPAAAKPQDNGDPATDKPDQGVDTLAGLPGS